MEAFYLALDFCYLQDLGFEGNCFIWCNGRKGGQRISERIDRFVANKEWKILKPKWLVSHRSAAYSDHTPILLSTEAELKKKCKKKLFRFEEM